jgi:hypothetical protein
MDKKKVAVLYYGIHQNYAFEECFLNFKKMIIEPNSNEYDFDFFFHRYIDKKGWYPWKNSRKINTNSMKINYDFINNVVKPKCFFEEPIIDFTDKKFHKILGDNLIYKDNLLYDTKNKNYVVYNAISRHYSIFKVNLIKNMYEKKNNLNYDLIITQESNNYFFEKLIINKINKNILNILGYWDFNKKIPTIFKTKGSGYLMPNSFYDVFIISNKELTNKYCNLYLYLKFYLSLPIQTCPYKNYDYHQPGYNVWKHIQLNKIIFKKINIISGLLRIDGVKINLHMCPDDKLYLVNCYERTDGLKLSKNAIDYIN